MVAFRMTRITRVFTSLLLISCLTVGVFLATASPFMNEHTRYPTNITIRYVGGTGPQNYTHIQDAIDNASSGDIIYVFAASSPYREDLQINTSLFLIGEEKTTTMIQGTQQGSVIRIAVDSVHVEGFTITGSKTGSQHAAIKISQGNGSTIQGNIFKDNQGNGILIQGPATHHLIAENLFTGNTNSVYGESVRMLSLTSNIIIHDIDGISLVSTMHSSITGNAIDVKKTGVTLTKSSDITFENNTITQNNLGAFILDCQDMLISQNTITANGLHGMWISQSHGLTILQNTFAQNVDIGLRIHLSDENTIEKNVFVENDNGLYLECCQENQVHHNYFWNYKINANFAAQTMKHFRNHWSRNYWEHARIIPYPVLGLLKTDRREISVIAFDWRPLIRTPSTPLRKGPLRLIKDNVTLYVGGSGPNNYSSIQDAVDNASDGDTIFVYSGVYNESVHIAKSIQLIGEQRDTTSIQTQGIEDVLTITSDLVTIENFTIQNGHFGINVVNASNIVIRHNRIVNNVHGVSLYNRCHYLKISYNIIEQNAYGIRLYFCSFNEISFNDISNYKGNAFFVANTAADLLNSWKRNYWGTPQILPYIILGKRLFNHITQLRFNIDWRPLLQPYNSILSEPLSCYEPECLNTIGDIVLRRIPVGGL